MRTIRICRRTFSKAHLPPSYFSSSKALEPQVQAPAEQQAWLRHLSRMANGEEETLLEAATSKMNANSFILEFNAYSSAYEQEELTKVVGDLASDIDKIYSKLLFTMVHEGKLEAQVLAADDLASFENVLLKTGCTQYKNLPLKSIFQLYFLASLLPQGGVNCQKIIFRTNRMLLSTNRLLYTKEVFSQALALAGKNQVKEFAAKAQFMHPLRSLGTFVTKFLFMNKAITQRELDEDSWPQPPSEGFKITLSMVGDLLGGLALQDEYNSSIAEFAAEQIVSMAEGGFLAEDSGASQEALTQNQLDSVNLILIHSSSIASKFSIDPAKDLKLYLLIEWALRIAVLPRVHCLSASESSVVNKALHENPFVRRHLAETLDDGEKLLLLSQSEDSSSSPSTFPTKEELLDLVRKSRKARQGLFMKQLATDSDLSPDDEILETISKELQDRSFLEKDLPQIMLGLAEVDLENLQGPKKDELEQAISECFLVIESHAARMGSFEQVALAWLQKGLLFKPFGLGSENLHEIINGHILDNWSHFSDEFRQPWREACE